MAAHDPTSGSSSSCKVSLVVTTRNDDHGGNMLRRTSIFVEGLLQLANKHRLSGELVIVEWNPPPGPHLHDLLKVGTHSEYFTIRCIEVPPEVHLRFRNSDTIPLFQMIAKNVGIRRSRGEFILATNADLLFSDQLVSFLAKGTLDRKVLYRLDRHDVEAEVPAHWPIEEQLEWCEAHLLRVHRRFGSVNLRQTLANRLIDRASDAQARPRGGSAKFTLWSLRRLVRSGLRALAKCVDPLPKIHSNGCGDFTLMAREQWVKLRGYPELPIWSMHVDSLLCFMAVSSGLKQVVLRSPMKVFHLEHQQSWATMNVEDRLRAFAVKPWLDVWLLEKLHEAMDVTRAPLCLNADDWGLASEQLHEVTMQSDRRPGEQRRESLVEVPG